MASKRRNEHAQMRREQYESMMDEDGSGECGGLVRASDEIIAKRRIVTARGSKRSAASTPSAPAPANPIAASSFKAPEPVSKPLSNPFAAFSGLTAPAAPSASANPFAAFKGLTSTTPASVVSSTTPSAPSTGFHGIVPPATTTTQSSTAKPSSKQGLNFLWIEAKVGKQSREEAKSTCLELLNKEFFAFVQEQVVENPMALWTTPIKEYMHHVECLEKDLDVLYGVKACDEKEAVASGASGGFTFGVPSPSTTLAPVTAPSAPKPSGIAFGATASAGDAPKPAGFTVGNKKDTAPAPSKSTDSKAKAVGFTFGPKNDSSPPFGEASNASGFSFGQPAKDSSPDSASKPSSASFSFGAASTTASPAFGSTPSDSTKPKMTSGFSFGTSTSGALFGDAKPSTGAASKPATGMSSFAAPPAAFSFGQATTSSVKASAPATSGFSFNLPNKPAASGASTPAAPANDDDDDDENIGREEATVIIKSDSEVDEEVLFEEAVVRLRQFKAAEKEWADLGSHPLKLLQHKTTKATRIVVRNSIGKVMLNAGLFAGLTIQAKPKSVLIPLMHEGKIFNFLFSIPPARIPEFKAEVEKNIPK
ncbi:hypothetical protein H310_13785 [Aphanomyces invadans]|uniref:RanBD1 domain-containing protein n=1 Tax=Aphanomyces invadans TaxID=157072 RepID=A0A024TDP1_9STRA|nr:hypothetical protein H310_13785 [Aphanomyces invadans]ETV91716.1 hypothetical protein H310_13785 [Aphanomyces invadans]|eukprot:XP_008879642.1 hypothetical protein H310_13785 [Aphanomyces invadans]